VVIIQLFAISESKNKEKKDSTPKEKKQGEKISIRKKKQKTTLTFL